MREALLTVRVDGKTSEIRTLPALKKLLEKKASEIWIEHGEGARLCALIAGELGWLMFLAEPGDSGRSSRNPGYRGSRDVVIAYRLSNGQVDEYPASWAYPLPTVLAALAEFAATGMAPASIEWHDD